MCESKELQTTEQKPNIQRMDVHDVRERREIIGTMMRSAMQPKIHFGKIPGCGDKPTLLKPGAEMICATFGLAPTFGITMRELQNGHREYETKCTIASISTGQILGVGVGMCTTLEKKYRYRNDYVNTGKNVPREYWDNHDISILGGRGFCAKKDDSGAYKIFKTSGEVENPYIADTFNTILKMSKKRAFIDAVLTVTGCSEFFTQDIEDFPAYRDAEFVPEDADPQPNKSKPSAPVAPKSSPHPAQTNDPNPPEKKPAPAVTAALKKFCDAIREIEDGIPDDPARANRNVAMKELGIKRLPDTPPELYDKFCARLQVLSSEWRENNAQTNKQETK